MPLWPARQGRCVQLCRLRTARGVAYLRASLHAMDLSVHYDSSLHVVVKYLVLTESICYNHFLTGGANVFRKWRPFLFLTEVPSGLAATLLLRMRGESRV